MDPAVRNRLDLLLVLCSAIFAIAVTQLMFGQGRGPQLLLIALFLTAFVLLVAYGYLETASAPGCDTEQSSDY